MTSCFSSFLKNPLEGLQLLRVLSLPRKSTRVFHAWPSLDLDRPCVRVTRPSFFLLLAHPRAVIDVTYSCFRPRIFETYMSQFSFFLDFAFPTTFRAYFSFILNMTVLFYPFLNFCCFSLSTNTLQDLNLSWNRQIFSHVFRVHACIWRVKISRYGKSMGWKSSPVTFPPLLAHPRAFSDATQSHFVSRDIWEVCELISPLLGVRFPNKFKPYFVII